MRIAKIVLGVLCSDDEKDMIIWEEEYYKPYAGKEKFEYSPYGKNDIN